MKLNLSVAVLATVAMALAASPADAQSKKKSGKSKAAKVTVSKPAPGYWSGGFNNCATSTSRMWFPLAALGAVGCGVVYAVPVAIEGYMAPRSSKA